MTVSSTTRRRAVGADVPVRSFGQRRVCAAPAKQVTKKARRRGEPELG
ncbi:MAG TPA: hypothetical protein VG411_19935 [Actinomycetota bacterium]|nr:hypothetical protein [Actinomycetota bacterium]